MAIVGRDLAERGYVALAVNYRLDTPAPHATQIADVESAIAGLRADADRLGVDPARIAVLGDSAGGNLAALAATRGGNGISALVAFSGVFDLGALADTGAADPERAWLLDALARYTRCAVACDAAYAALSPVAHVDGGDPPALLIDAADELIPTSQADVMADALRGAGVDVERLTIPGHAHGRGLFDAGWAAAVDFLARTV
jgi:acetyl esterase/lipase